MSGINLPPPSSTGISATLDNPSRPGDRRPSWLRLAGRTVHVLLLTLMLVAAQRQAQANSLNVVNGGDSGAGTLRDCVATAFDGDTIYVRTNVTLSTGEIVIDKSLTIAGAGASTTSVTGGGGRVFQINSGTVKISGLTITGGNGIGIAGPLGSVPWGGGINTNMGSTTDLQDCVISNNTAASDGGGVNSEGNLTMERCTLSGNTAVGRGGGVWAPNSLTQCTIANNSASLGGGVYSYGCTVIACTISANSAPEGGGLYSAFTASLQNTIVAKNTAPIGPDLRTSAGSTIASRGYNFIGNIGNTGDATFPALMTDIVGTPILPKDPFLGVLGDNGGTTPTMALFPGSLAVDNGDDSLVSLGTDQIGQPRLSGAHVDIGAFEYQNNSITPVKVTNLADSGPGSLRYAIANTTPGNVIDLTHLKGTITLYTGELLINSSVTLQGPGAGSLAISGNGISRVITNNATTTIFGITLRDGNSPKSGWGGGAIQNNGSLTLTNCTITHNYAISGGGITNLGYLALATCNVNGNLGGWGSGIANVGYLTMDSSTIANNTTTSGSGGGIINLSTLVANDCTISGNKAVTLGGGIDNLAYVTLTQCTVSGNSAASQGGGIYNSRTGSLTASACTISNNKAGYQGGGIWTGTNTTPRTSLKSTIVAQNTAPAGPDVFGPFKSSGYNLIGDPNNSTGFTNKYLSDQVGAPGKSLNAKLGTLSKNGGPTQTQALLPGSPAIDTGFDPGLFSSGADQCYNNRKVRNVDIGAVEAQFGPLSIVLSSTVPVSIGSKKSTATLSATVQPNGSPTTVNFYLNGAFVGSAQVPGNVTSGSASYIVSVPAGNRLYSYYATATNNGVTIWPGWPVTPPAGTLFHVGNHPPVASDVYVSVSGTSPVVIDLSKYVSDPDSDNMFVDLGAPAFGTVTGTSASGTVSGSSLATYTPTGVLASPDSFTYTVTDIVADGLSASGSATGTVYLTPAISSARKGLSASFQSSANLSGSNLKVSAAVTLSASSLSGTVTTVGIPAISDSSSPVVAAMATLQVTGMPLPPAVARPVTATAGAILSGSLGGTMNVVAAQFQSAPDTTGTGSFGTFASFTDPVIDANGNIAFIAKIAGTGIAANVNDTGIWTTAPTGTLHRLRLIGVDSPKDAGMAKVSSFQAISLLSGSLGALSGSTGEVLVYQATLASSGTSPVTAANNSGIWSQMILPSLTGTIPTMTGTLSEKLLVRTGVPSSLVGGTTVKSFTAFSATSGSPGQGRTYSAADYLALQAILSDGRPAIAHASVTGSAALETLVLGGTNGSLLGSTDPRLSGSSVISGSSVLSGTALILGTAVVSGSAIVSGSTVVSGTTITSGTTAFLNGTTVTSATTTVFQSRWLALGVPAMSGTQIAVSGTCQISTTTSVKTTLVSGTCRITKAGSTLTLTSGTSQVSTTSSKLSLTSTAGIFVSGTAGDFEPVALVGGQPNYSDGSPWVGTTFTALKDPVTNPAAASEIAFIGNVTGGISGTGATGIWWTGTNAGSNPPPLLIALTGGNYAVTFTSFPSIALVPDANSGLIFVATLAGTGVTTSNNVGLFFVSAPVSAPGSDPNVAQVQLVRTGDLVSVGGTMKTLKSIDVIGVGTAPSTPGVTRSFNGQRKVTYRATFQDGSQAIMTMDL